MTRPTSAFYRALHAVLLADYGITMSIEPAADEPIPGDTINWQRGDDSGCFVLFYDDLNEYNAQAIGEFVAAYVEAKIEAERVKAN